MQTFLFYDLETTGTDRARDRIVQFGGVRTDQRLQPLGEPVELYCGPAPDVLPSVEATLVHGVTPAVAARRGSVEAVFAERLHAELARPGTCSVGYNAMSFDHEFVRFLLYRNLRDPYRWAYAEGNSRWDLIDVVRAAHALRPDGIHWPRREDGSPSFNLERLAAANDIEQRRAHDALSDVHALLGIGRLVRLLHPRLWSYALGLRTKHGVRPHLRGARSVPMLLVDGRIDASLGCTTAFLALGQREDGHPAEVIWDLRRDPEPFFELPTEELRERLFAPRDGPDQAPQRPGLRTIHPGRSPFIVTSKLLRDDALCARLQLDKAAVRRRFRALMATPDFAARCRRVYSGPPPRPSEPPDVDARLYEGFFSDADRHALTRVREAALRGGPLQLPGGGDPRVPGLALRYLGRNFPKRLDASARARWESHLADRLYAPDESGHSPLDRWIAGVAEQRASVTGQQAALLEELEAWGRARKR